MVENRQKQSNNLQQKLVESLDLKLRARYPLLYIRALRNLAKELKYRRQTLIITGHNPVPPTYQRK